LKASEHAIEEGREVLSLLRSTAPKASELPMALRDLAAELVAGGHPEINIAVDGNTRQLTDETWNEVYGICREAISNSVRHAQANEINIHLSFGGAFRFAIGDNGKGINLAIAEKGRAGHFGILGMRERAENLDAAFKIDTINANGNQQGTLVEITVPAQRAYA